MRHRRWRGSGEGPITGRAFVVLMRDITHGPPEDAEGTGGSFYGSDLRDHLVPGPPVVIGRAIGFAEQPPRGSCARAAPSPSRSQNCSSSRGGGQFLA